MFEPVNILFVKEGDTVDKVLIVFLLSFLVVYLTFKFLKYILEILSRYKEIIIGIIALGIAFVIGGISAIIAVLIIIAIGLALYKITPLVCEYMKDLSEYVTFSTRRLVKKIKQIIKY